MTRRAPVYKFTPGVTNLISGKLYWYVYQGTRFTLKARISGKPSVFSHDFFENTSPQTIFYDTVNDLEAANPILFPGDRIKVKTGQRYVNEEADPRPYSLVESTPFIGVQPLVGFINTGTSYVLDIYAPFVSDGYNMQNRILPNRTISIGKIDVGTSVTVVVRRRRLNSSTSSNDYLYINPTDYTLNYVTPPDTTSGVFGLFSFPQTLNGTHTFTFTNSAGVINVTKS